MVRVAASTMARCLGERGGRSRIGNHVYPGLGDAVWCGTSPTNPTDISASLGWRLASPNAPSCSAQIGGSPSASSAARIDAAPRVSPVCGARQGRAHRSRSAEPRVSRIASSFPIAVISTISILYELVREGRSRIMQRISHLLRLKSRSLLIFFRGWRR
jgi:hypothetical protein